MDSKHHQVFIGNRSAISRTSVYHIDIYMTVGRRMTFRHCSTGKQGQIVDVARTHQVEIEHLNNCATKVFSKEVSSFHFKLSPPFDDHLYGYDCHRGLGRWNMQIQVCLLQALMRGRGLLHLSRIIELPEQIWGSTPASKKISRVYTTPAIAYHRSP